MCIRDSLYGEREVDLLQQILFYRALGVPLKEIARIVQADGFDRLRALESHLSALYARQAQTDVYKRQDLDRWEAGICKG